ncbi:LANO_0G15984g1_1 [Lachancea nothofagi CBS 11611]|uniref:LANO_0G15984g1_1 n=1 Tax=Lachancea nothofagi CBS 11611 TaxID=1266666 RepID=A0A1G4KKJ2_9SACH|nr:LANO_0G15984g1_1 [Lachancea nothofagi CBS 11611]
MSVSQKLIENHKVIFDKAVHHKLAGDLCAGTLPDKKLYIYLAQDLQFFQSGMRLLTKTTSLAPDNHSLLTLAKKIGFFANDENNYFYDCLAEVSDSLSPSDQDYFKNNQLPQVKKYIKYLERSAKDETSYAKLITFVYCMELVYVEWPKYFPHAANLHWKHQTWIDLHAGEHFETWCDFLRDEVDKCDYEEVSETFRMVLELEFEFFEACYQQ